MKTAQVGLGTLVLAIAGLLIAAIGAGVLIQTANTLQTSALSTGSQATSQASSGFQILSVYGTDFAQDRTIEQFIVELKLTPASSVVNLGDLSIDTSVGDQVNSWQFSHVGDCDVQISSGFVVEYLFEAQNHVAQYLQQGEVVRICFAPPVPVGESESVSLTFLPATGIIQTIDFVTPSVYTRNTIYVFP
ncbi:MAG: hypothetical protein ACMXYF_04235 [Candidatus Woesearchaeota archaeon]